MKFHHIGIATENIESELVKLKKHFNILNISEIVYDKNQDAYLCMLTLNDGMMIELISGNVVQSLVKKRQFLYHTCYSVNNINNKINELINEGAYLVSEPKEAILFNNKKVSFLLWDLGLIELVEED